MKLTCIYIFLFIVITPNICQLIRTCYSPTIHTSGWVESRSYILLLFLYDNWQTSLDRGIEEAANWLRSSNIWKTILKSTRWDPLSLPKPFQFYGILSHNDCLLIMHSCVVTLHKPRNSKKWLFGWNNIILILFSPRVPRCWRN